MSVFREIHVSDLLPRIYNADERLLNDRSLHLLTVNVAHLKVMYFNKIRILTGCLLIACGVNLKLKPRHLLWLRVFSGFEVNNCDLVGISPANQVNSTANNNAISKLQFDRLLDMFKSREMLTVFFEVLTKCIFRPAN